MKIHLISIVIPLKNEASNITALHEALSKVDASLDGYNFEYVYVDDGSTDNSLEILHKLQSANEQVRVIQLARNFGKEIATTAGLHAAKGEAAIMIDADLQHPPELIPQFIARWEAGDDVVIGKQKPDASYASFTKRLTARWFYALINHISHTQITPHATDYRLLDRAVINEFNKLTEHNRLTRGLIDWLGFTRSYIEFTPAKRLHGDRSYSYRQLVRLATNSIVSLSFFPLKIAGYLGGIIVLISTPLIIFIMGNRLLFGNSMEFTGSATLAAMLLFLVGIVLICQGLMALYVANIYGEVQNRPLYIEKRPRRTQP
jgi:dolichol-phosphate mannosyltransferase